MHIQTCIVLSCICVVTGETSFWIDTEHSARYEPHPSETQTSWWEAAYHQCAKSDGHLFVPHGKVDKDRVKTLLIEHEVYWVGGFQYPYLKWTEDDTRYHTRVGHMYADVVTPVTVQYNSASNCARRCGNNHQLYGLQRTSCYCLGYNPERNGIIAGYAAESRCSGYSYHWCGSDLVMSVYKKVSGFYNSYYTRVGYMYAGSVTPVTLPYNSALSCHLSCGNSHGLFGLKGTSCYCLGLYVKAYTITEGGKTEIRCPGDYDERCGDDWVMTVYQEDSTSVPLSLNGKCGYVERYLASNGYEYVSYRLDDNCRNKRPYICAADTGCYGSTCVKTTLRTWGHAYRECKLAKPTKSDIWNIQRDKDYWIGLERSAEGKWINGKPTESNSYHLDRGCLGMHRNGSSLLLNWYDCSLLRPALCNTVKRETTPLIFDSTSTVRPSTYVSGASTQVVRASTDGSSAMTFPESTAEPELSTATDFSQSSERTTFHHMKGFVNKGTDRGEDHPSGFTVIYIAGAASVLAVGTVITLVLVFLKRQRRYCFKMEDEREDGVHYDSGVENLSYSLAGPGSQSATNEYAIPCPARTEKKAHMSTKSNIPNENLVTNSFIQEESVYNVTEETSPVKPTGHISQGENTTSNPLDEGACFEDEGQYNVLHGQVSARGTNSGMYAHLGQGEGDVVYDTTRHLQNTEQLSDTYNHTGESKDPDADNESQYDVLRRSQSSADGSTGIYDHTTTSADQRNKVSAVQRPIRQAVDDIYSHVDRASKRPKQDKLDTAMEVKEHKRHDAKNTGKEDIDCDSVSVSGGNSTEHVYGNTEEIIGPRNRAPCVEDEADYYNIDSVRESKLGGTSKGDENNVYSLAHGFSDK
ncbi:uncharacterized protein [Haliotis asinina]|uniref:uncharacterized protein n=1 Tax=Haliotis asinina TaxID=109174 RepID=UPI003531AAFE